MLLLLMFLAGPGMAFAGPLADSEARAPEVSADESFDLLDRVWEWIVALAGTSGNPGTGGGHVPGSDFGPFLDPNGSD